MRRSSHMRSTRHDPSFVGAAITAALTIATPVWAQGPVTSKDLNRQELNRFVAPAEAARPVATVPQVYPQQPQPPANLVAAGRPPHPASWYYDPYTSGSAPRLQGGPG
jgi:hypothetical protein